MVGSQAPEFFVSGLDHIELIGGGCARFVWFVNQTDDEGNVRRQPVLNVVVPVDAFPDAILQATMALAVAALGNAEHAYN